ncbi:AraC family transcriptional regulator [Pseudacidovorax sp. RU35E]|uniref:AraC family transcriptional regulator n=1 Tax=Pseudacidovorax sp. RU35E TaxID=1907403 RepID=UPI000957015C|nr:AraC family transcriptional regulator [Pseudacidovorax sp. RU35E]SIQ12450.1 transcriptional regulator, AraC family [Pseudacidovorax sp. RU35E]
MDVLSDVLAICRAERAVTAHFSLGAPWALSSAGVPGVMLRISRGAPYWVQVHGESPVQVLEGDLLMLPLGSPHVLASSPGLAPTPFADLIAQHADGARDENPLVFRHGGDGAVTEIFSTLLWFSAYSRHAVLRLLPPLLHVRQGDMPAGGSLAGALQALVQETLSRRPGWRLSAERMGELLLVNILRERLGDAARAQAGWLRGLGDPAIARALQGIHHAPHDDWDIARLASAAAMSRSRFCLRFKSLVGSTPIGYLTAHRMTLAAEQLEAGRLTVAQAAAQAGYESDKVFARAFRRWSGLTPAAYLKRERARRQALGGFGEPAARATGSLSDAGGRPGADPQISRPRMSSAPARSPSSRQ